MIERRKPLARGKPPRRSAPDKIREAQDKRRRVALERGTWKAAETDDERRRNGWNRTRSYESDPSLKVWATCETCGRKFWRWRSQVKHRGPARFCSWPCQDQRKIKRLGVVCDWCGKTTYKPIAIIEDLKRGRFCNVKCLSAWRRSRVLTLKCDQCGKTFERRMSFDAKRKGDKAFCSKKCAGQYQSGPNHHAYRGETLPRRGKRWKELANVVRDRDGRCCVRCHLPEAENFGKALNVDHVLPARLFGKDWWLADDLRNLASLCCTCHAVKTHRYEPRILKGDMLALDEFYGRGTRQRVLVLLNAVT